MSDQIHSTPGASQPAATPAPVPTPMAEAPKFSRPSTTNATAPHQPGSAPATVAPPAPIAHAPTTSESQTLNEKLNTADRYWKFKIILRAIAILTGLIGIGTIGWCVSTAPRFGYLFDYEAFWALWPTLITFSISVVWCLACILVFLLRKRPVHPGACVAMELLLWLGFIVTALFAMVALMDLLSWGQYGDLGYESGFSNSGGYELANNGTWIWERGPAYTTDSRECNRTSDSSSSYYYYGFRTCEEQDAYINQLWREKPHRSNVELTGVVCQFFGLLLHLALFVWACIDCHHHNRSKVSKDAEKLAADIVQKMITNGVVIPPPGQAYVRPTAWEQPQTAYYQLPPQQQQSFPLAAMSPQSVPKGQHAP